VARTRFRANAGSDLRPQCGERPRAARPALGVDRSDGRAHLRKVDGVAAGEECAVPCDRTREPVDRHLRHRRALDDPDPDGGREISLHVRVGDPRAGPERGRHRRRIEVEHVRGVVDPRDP
jgi:hypothetical protein